MSTDQCDDRPPSCLVFRQVAGPSEAKCLGISDFVEQDARKSFGKEVFQPKKCIGRFPIGNMDFTQLDPDGRKQFALQLTLKVNG